MLVIGLSRLHSPVPPRKTKFYNPGSHPSYIPNHANYLQEGSRYLWMHLLFLCELVSKPAYKCQAFANDLG
jgi:hypothetical protein